tara:strand:+ start:877 stop:1002 length:126 start_codon:yes stop_codon:yes gene_type:complete
MNPPLLIKYLSKIIHFQTIIISAEYYKLKVNEINFVNEIRI